MELCSICIETFRDGEKCVPLKRLVDSELCRCNYVIHSACLHDWMTQKNNNCLICSEQLQIKRNPCVRALRRFFQYCVFLTFAIIYICFIVISSGIAMLF